MIPAALAPETRLQMKRGDTINGSRPTTGPLAQTLRFQSERRNISLATVSSISPVELVSDCEIWHTGQVLSAPQLATFDDVDAAPAMCPALQRSEVGLPDSTPGLSMSSRETRVLSEAAHAHSHSRGLSEVPGTSSGAATLSVFVDNADLLDGEEGEGSEPGGNSRPRSDMRLDPAQSVAHSGEATLYLPLYTLLTQMMCCLRACLRSHGLCPRSRAQAISLAILKMLCCLMLQRTRKPNRTANHDHTQGSAGQTVHFSGTLGIVTQPPTVSANTPHGDILHTVLGVTIPGAHSTTSDIPGSFSDSQQGYGESDSAPTVTHAQSIGLGDVVTASDMFPAPLRGQRYPILFSLNPHLIYL